MSFFYTPPNLYYLAHKDGLNHRFSINHTVKILDKANQFPSLKTVVFYDDSVRNRNAFDAMKEDLLERGIRAKRVDMNPGIGNTSLQNTRIVNIKVNPDREKNGGTIQTVVNVNQYENPFHYYTIKNVVARTVNVMGDASVELLGVTQHKSTLICTAH